MAGARRKLAFVLASSNHGTMIVNRLDYRMVNAESGYGVGFQILETASFDPAASSARSRGFAGGARPHIIE